MATTNPGPEEFGDWRVQLEPMTWASSTLVVVEHLKYGRAEKIVTDRMAAQVGFTLEEVASELKEALFQNLSAHGPKQNIHVDRSGQKYITNKAEPVDAAPHAPAPDPEEVRKRKLADVLKGAKVAP